MAHEITDPVDARREEVLQQLIREYRERHQLPALCEVLRIPGVPSIRERAVREFAERQAVTDESR